MAESRVGKKSTHQQKFREEYKTMFPCMTVSNKGEGYAFCKICRCDLKISSGGSSDLAKHINKKKHLDNEEQEQKSATFQFLTMLGCFALMQGMIFM